MYNDPHGDSDPNRARSQQPSSYPIGGQQQPPDPHGQQPYTQYNNVPPYNAAPPLPDYAVPQQQPGRSLKWLWITLAIVGGVFVLGCAICGVVLYEGGRIASQSVTQTIKSTSPALVTNEYYQAIEIQDYATAYSYLDPNIRATNGKIITQNDFTTSAKNLDTQNGTVSNFTVSSSPGVDSSGTKAGYTVNVTRGSTTYSSNITLMQTGGSWKIVSYSAI